MLIVSGTPQHQNRRHLASVLRRPHIITGLVVCQSRLLVEAKTWRDYWRPASEFVEADTRLVHRLKRLRAAWLDVLRRNCGRRRWQTYCWRYFGLLHHTLQIAKTDPRRGEPWSMLRRILAFGTFRMKMRGASGTAAGVASDTNPLYLLGRLAPDCPPSTPRHMPLVLPLGSSEPYYNYRQIVVEKSSTSRIMLCPSVDLSERSGSFNVIDRFTRLVSAKPDPYWKPRARLLARRILTSLLRAWRRTRRTRDRDAELAILDLGAGTGHLSARIWRHLWNSAPADARSMASLHFVDTAGPTFGRSFGVSRANDCIRNVEWTRADYRSLLDDDDWLAQNGPFDWVFLCRLLDNASNFAVERIDGMAPKNEAFARCQPHRCLAPRRWPDGLRDVAVRTVRRAASAGTAMPQFSLSEYFGAMRAVMMQNLDAVDSSSCYLPIRRYNPASLTTCSGRSILGQLMKTASAIVIEDLDLMPEHLQTHREQFGLSGTAAVHCVADGFVTESQQYVVMREELAKQIPGKRLW